VSADLRYALRQLRRAPGFALVVALVLALGIGVNTAIFSVVNAVLLRDLPYRAADRLVMAFTTYPDFGHSSTSLPDFLDWRAGFRGTGDLAAFGNASYNVTGDGAPERAKGAAVTADYFRVLGAPPAHGRAFTPDEERGAMPGVAMLGHGFWQRRFNGDPRVVGGTITLNGIPRTIVGVAPATLTLPDAPDVLVPLRTDSAFGRRAEYLKVIGRLGPGVTLEQGRAVLATVNRRLQAQYPETNSERLTIDLVPMRDEIVGAARPALLVFMGAVGLVLLVACANIANLLLVRATVREREVAVRTALGASRGRVFRQFLVESLVLALAGGVAGLALAAAIVRLLRATATDAIPRLGEVGLDARALAFTLVLSVGTGLLFGIAPALRLAREQVQQTLRGGGRGIAGGAGRLRAGLVLAEVALSVVLLVGAGLLLRSFVELQRVQPGFDAERVLTFQVSLPSTAYPSVDTQVRPFWNGLLERARGLPGVRTAAVTSTIPLTGANYLTFDVAGREAQPGEDLQPFMVSDGYFRAMGVPIVRGRTFTAADGAGAPRVAVINAEAARRFWPGRDPIGARITTGDTTDYMTIVGVVADVRQEGMSAKPYPQLYGVAAQNPMRAMYVVVRTAGDPNALAGAMRRAVAALDPQLPVYNVATMQERVAQSVARPRVTAVLVALFGASALGLAAFGIYGVVAFSVAQRTRELGVRVAVGARPGDVVRLVVRQGMQPAVAGVAVGLVVALAAARLIAGLLFGVGAADPLTFAGVALFLAGVALAATWLPARRATRVSPLEALRAD
jgi:predicted permease